MKKTYLMSMLFIVVFYSCGLFESDGGYDLPNERVYVALQAFDQVGIVDVKSGHVDHVDINYSVLSCSDYLLENDCNLAEGCEWMSMGGMSHCMDSDDECMELSVDDCNAAQECDWMSMGGMSHCMDSDDECMELD